MADALLSYVRSIAKQTGRQVPTPNPAGSTTRALALFVLRDPGATPESGANATNLLDPYANDDRTSIRQRSALRAAKIDPDVCVWWNAVPYHLGYKGAIKDRDVTSGARYLHGFIERCPDLRVVVAMGDDARKVCAGAWRGAEPELPPLISTWHPMTRGSGGQERQKQLAADLRKAAKLIQAPAKRSSRSRTRKGRSHQSAAIRREMGGLEGLDESYTGSGTRVGAPGANVWPCCATVLAGRLGLWLELGKVRRTLEELGCPKENRRWLVTEEMAREVETKLR